MPSNGRITAPRARSHSAPPPPSSPAAAATVSERPARLASHEVVLNALRWEIGVGRWAPGQLLPNERELAESFGVGRSTLRAALADLRAAGLLVTARGRHGGTRIAHSGREANLSAADRSAARRTLCSNFEYRRIVEPPAAALAAEHADAADLHELDRLLNEPVDSVRTYRAVDSTFHIRIATASGNAMLRDSVAQARFELFTWADSLWLAEPDWNDLDLEYRDFALTHRPIYDELARRDAAGAAAAVTAHLEHGERSYLERLDRLG